MTDRKFDRNTHTHSRRDDPNELTWAADYIGLRYVYTSRYGTNRA